MEIKPVSYAIEEASRRWRAGARLAVEAACVRVASAAAQRRAAGALDERRTSRPRRASREGSKKPGTPQQTAPANLSARVEQLPQLDDVAVPGRIA